MAYGRGGAGNIQEANASISADLEANQQAADDYTSSGHDFDTKEQAPYAHMGRGGAGNYYSPRGLIERGQFQGADRSHVLGDGTPMPKDQSGVEGSGGTQNMSGEGQEVAEGSLTKPTNGARLPSTPYTSDGGSATVGNNVGVASSAPVGRTGAYTGRGGAGNYSFGGLGQSKKPDSTREQDEEREKERLRGQIERGVEEGLARPEKAKVAGGEPW